MTDSTSTGSQNDPGDQGRRERQCSQAFSQSPVIVLFEPQLPENVGMCSRAMLNCGLDQLRLVNPRCDWQHPAAVAAASGADEVLKKAKPFSRLEATLEDCHRVFATTARTRSLRLPAREIGEAAREAQQLADDGKRIGFLFGPESSGLGNEQLSHADALVHLPTNPEFSSLNLAQAVLVVAWEWRRAGSGGSDGSTGGTENAELGEDTEESSRSAETTWTPATHGELTNFLGRLESELDDGGFFLTPELRPTTLQQIRAIFQRARLTERELALLHGAVTALRKG